MKATLRRIATFLRKPQNIILILLVISLAYLVVWPLVNIFQDTFLVHPSEVSRVKQEAGSFTTYHWTKVFADKDSYKTFVQPLINSVLCAVLSCAIAILVGGLFAYLVIRTDMRGKKFCSSLFMLLYIMPAWTLAIAWTNFFKNQMVGGAMGLFEAVTGLSTPNWFAYGLFPVVVVTGMHYSPYAYILIGGILRNMDSNLEEAAQILKASRARIFWRVTIPLVRPAIMSTILLVFASGLSVFSTAQFLGLPVGFHTLATKMYSYLNGTNPGRGYVYTFVMLLLSMVVLYINQKMLGTRKSYTTVSGKSSNVSLTRLRKARTTISVLVIVFTVCVTILPFISFALESLTKFSVRRGIIPALYGSFFLLALIGTIKYLPMASRSGLNSMFQISATIEESAQIMGVPWHKRMLRILVPIQKTSILSGYLLPFISCMREMELFVMLYTPSSMLLTTLLFFYNQKGYDQFANAITLIIVIVIVTFNALINKITGASIDSGIGG